MFSYHLQVCVCVCVAYHWNPSFQSSVPFELIALIGLENEFVVKPGPRHARVGVKVAGVLRQACMNAFFWASFVGHYGVDGRRVVDLSDL